MACGLEEGVVEISGECLKKDVFRLRRKLFGLVKRNLSEGRRTRRRRRKKRRRRRERRRGRERRRRRSKRRRRGKEEEEEK